MEPMTALVLAFQLLALFSIAGALLIYLICKVRADSVANLCEAQQPTTVLVTSADTALGLQLCTHLASKGCRVFAGMKDAQDSLPAKLLAGWLKMRNGGECGELLGAEEEPVRGSIIPCRMDVTREDVLRELTLSLGAHLNAGERGISAVINTSGAIYRGRVEAQDVLQWESMLRINILGSLRVAKAFMSFLRPTRGRLIYLGAGTGGVGDSDGLVAFNASRMAVEKCAEELRKELQPYGISVIALDTGGMPAEELYKAPVPSHTDDGAAPTQYSADVLSCSALQVLDRALWDVTPQERYQLSVPHGKYHFTLPCRSSLRASKTMSTANGHVQRV